MTNFCECIHGKWLVQARKQTNKCTHACVECNAVMLVWGLLRVSPNKEAIYIPSVSVMSLMHIAFCLPTYLFDEVANSNP